MCMCVGTVVLREQEFGNLQDLDYIRQHSLKAEMVGRFYYRRPNGESSADVFDRISDFWESVMSLSSAGVCVQCVCVQCVLWCA